MRYFVQRMGHLQMHLLRLSADWQVLTQTGVQHTTVYTFITELTTVLWKQVAELEYS